MVGGFTEEERNSIHVTGSGRGNPKISGCASLASG